MIRTPETEIDRLTLQEIKKLNKDEKAIIDVLTKLVNATSDELLRLSKPAAEATHLHMENKLYHYNLTMLAKYCHLIGGIWYLLEKNNYYSALIIQRATFEIKFNLRYFYLQQNELEEYYNSAKYNSKFSMRNIIERVVGKGYNAEKEYGHYKFLSTATHPATDLAPLLLASEFKKDEASGNVKARIQFNPIYNKTGYMYGLLGVAADNVRVIENEYLILKDIPGLVKNDDLVDATNKTLEILTPEILWAQKGIRAYYAKLKAKKLSDVDKPFSELGENRADVLEFLYNPSQGMDVLDLLPRDA